VTAGTPSLEKPEDLAALRARVALLEEENRWLKSQLFGRSSEKTPPEERNPDQGWLFNEIAAWVEKTTQSITIPAHERGKRGRRKLSAHLPRIEVLHDLTDAEKVCPLNGSTFERIGEETSEQLEVIPAQVRVIRHIRPKYACPRCRSGVKIAPVPPAIFPKSLATPRCSRTSAPPSLSTARRFIARSPSSSGSVCHSGAPRWRSG
jgi:transposase